MKPKIFGHRTDHRPRTVGAVCGGADGSQSAIALIGTLRQQPQERSLLFYCHSLSDRSYLVT
ncbi:hypothetical protein G3T18_06070 [Oscillatoria salina IIICB1]|nr:hypothetical protein [Oscillatoria salina IIICB1]